MAPDASVRDTLLEVAVELFSQKEYQAVSTRELTKRAGVTLSSLAHYYGDKRGLYIAANLRELRKISARLEAAIGVAGPPQARLFSFASEFSRVLGEPAYMIVRRQHLGGDPEAINSIARETFPAQVEQVAAAITGLGGEGMPVTVGLYALLHGLHSIRRATNALPWDTQVPTDPEGEALYALKLIMPGVDWDAAHDEAQAEPVRRAG